MIRDFQAAFRVSKIEKYLILLFIFILSGIIMMYFSVWRSIVLLAILWLMGGWVWHEKPKIQYLLVDDEYQAWLLLRNQNVLCEATLLSGSLIHRWGCFLRWKCDNQLFWQMILPDMLDEQSFRRVRVWAMFGQKK